MDINKLVEVLRATLQPDQREEAEKHLTEVTSVRATLFDHSTDGHLVGLWSKRRQVKTRQVKTATPKRRQKWL